MKYKHIEYSFLYLIYFILIKKSCFVVNDFVQKKKVGNLEASHIL